MIPSTNQTVFHPEFELQIGRWLKFWKLRTANRILIVVDPEICIAPRPDGREFGIANVIELLRGTQVGCMRLSVDIAQRTAGAFEEISSPALTQARYRGFRFDSIVDGKSVIDGYDQIWCFGFKPNNDGSSDDSVIDQAGALPASDAELERLDDWMTRKKGGLFGTGDHHFLGASMCRRIPRLGTMRRWTNADGVPPQGGPFRPPTEDRIDTLRPPPPTSDYLPGGPGSLANTPHQGDLTLQPINWVSWKSRYVPFGFRVSRPHPVLCHPTLGPIDVMPDHAHEGLCVPEPDLGASKQFNGELEYPDALDGGDKPAPTIIAYGSTLSSDHWDFQKGEQPARKRVPMISVYDGHLAGVGRVATDTTWHHWMDVNVNEIRSADNDDWKKVSRYFINLAVWLTPPNLLFVCFYAEVAASHFDTVGFQEYSSNASARDIGSSLRRHLVWKFGPCWVSDLIWRIPIEAELIKAVELERLAPVLSNSKVTSEIVEEVVLGYMAKAVMDDAELIKAGKQPDPIGEPEKLFLKAFRAGIKELEKDKKLMRKGERKAMGKIRAK